MPALPLTWYKVDGVLQLIAGKRKLFAALTVTYGLCAAAFGTLFGYYKTIKTEQTFVTSSYDVPGWTCRPLTPDEDYGLNLTYDECISKHYRAPMMEDLEIIGDFSVTWSYDWNQYIYDGPWNFTGTNVAHPLTLMTAYHTPFPGLSEQIYTYNKRCVVPHFKSAEQKADYVKGDISYEPLNAALKETMRQMVEVDMAFPPFGLSNWDVNVPQNLDDLSLDAHKRKLTFFPNASTNFNTACGGNFTESMQNDLRANGTYIFPRVFFGDLTFSEEPNFYAFQRERAQIKVNRRSVGIMPLYTKDMVDKIVDYRNYPDTMKRGEAWDYIAGSRTRWFDFLERCEYLERKFAVEAYEFIYSHENCHPCDSFKYASPFLCERVVPKTVSEAITLASSNVMALLSVSVALIPLMVVSKLKHEDDKTKNSKKLTNDEAPALTELANVAARESDAEDEFTDAV